MKAMLVNEDQALIWTEVPDPEVKDDEVLVKIHAAGVNRADLLQRVGKYPSPPGCPPWMGLEVAGTIEKCGARVRELSDWKVGDAVAALLGGGGYAEYVAVKYDMLLPVPKGLSMAEAATLPEAFATSYLNLFKEGHLEAGESIFIPAGASGLASAAIPLAKAFGARVITSVQTADKAESIRHLGADIIIDTSKEKPEDVLRAEEEAGRPISVAMDCLSGETLGLSLPYMAQGGYWVVISTLAGIETTVQLRPLLTKGLHLVGSMLRKRTPAFKAELLHELTVRVWPKIESGELRVPAVKTFPMADAMKVHGMLERGENVGKVALIL